VPLIRSALKVLHRFIHGSFFMPPICGYGGFYFKIHKGTKLMSEKTELDITMRVEKRTFITRRNGLKEMAQFFDEFHRAKDVATELAVQGGLDPETFFRWCLEMMGLYDFPEATFEEEEEDSE
jgi:hypothetical protein